MATTLGDSDWELKKTKILVSAPDFNVDCVVRVRIAHKRSTKQGSVTLSIMAALANSSEGLQVLRLVVPPELLEKFAFGRSNDDLLPPSLFRKLPASVERVSHVFTLTLRLRKTGIVFSPSKMDSLSPASPGDSAFHSFAKICESTFLRLHISERQFAEGELAELRRFSKALSKKGLQAESFDHAGHGVVPKDWRVFNLSPDPPPYHQVPVSEQVKQDPPPYPEEAVFEQTVWKRRRGNLLFCLRCFVIQELIGST